MEARLFEEGTVPFWTTPEFFAAHPWISPAHQRGHRERTELAAQIIKRFVRATNATSLVDLGCGDGSLLGLLGDLRIPKWGYDAGVQNVERATSLKLDVRLVDLLSDTPIEYGDLIVATEMVEHLVDPHGFIASLPGDKLVLTSPSAETADWHYEHHAWAWDMDGYRDMVQSAGWTMVLQDECSAEANTHGGETRPQRFQALAAIR